MDSCAGAPPASAPCSEPHFQSRCPAGGPAGCSHVGTNPVRRDNATVLRFRHNPKTSTPLLPQIAALFGIEVVAGVQAPKPLRPPRQARQVRKPRDKKEIKLTIPPAPQPVVEAPVAQEVVVAPVAEAVVEAPVSDFTVEAEAPSSSEQA